MTATEEWKDAHSKKKLDKVEMVRLENVVVATASDDAMTHLWKPLQVNFVLDQIRFNIVKEKFTFGFWSYIIVLVLYKCRYIHKTNI